MLSEGIYLILLKKGIGKFLNTSNETGVGPPVLFFSKIKYLTEIKMHKKSIIKILIIASAIFLVLSLAGCNIWESITAASDKSAIFQIGENIDIALQQKDVSLFMQNISYNYSDADGNNFNTVDSIAEELISQVEEIEDLAADSLIKDVVVDVSINNLVLAELYANAEMKINISIKYFNYIPTFWLTDNYPKTILFNVNFQKNGSEWEIISMEEI